jgi:hypothetical protein
MLSLTLVMYLLKLEFIISLRVCLDLHFKNNNLKTWFLKT